MADKDYYAILGVDKSADDRTIKKAYRQKAMEFHPDRNPGDRAAEDNFKLAAEAYEVLSNAEKRQIYDTYGSEGLRGHGVSGFSGVNDIFSHFSDIFGDFFGGDIFGGGRRSGRRGSTSRARRGADLRDDLVLTFEEALAGCHKEVEIVHAESCVQCAGEGHEPGTQRETCNSCNGSGQEVHSRGMFMITTTCSRCRGRGYFIPSPCKHCDGSGRAQVKKRVMVKVPAGIDSGVRVRVSGEGEAGAKGGPPGDLYLDIELAAHPLFKRQDQHVVYELHIPFVQAIFGATIPIPTLGGERELEIPAGTQHHDVLPLRKLGFPELRGSDRGDQLNVVFVDIPKPRTLTKEQADLLLDYAKLSKISTHRPKKGLFQKIIDKVT